MKSNRQNAPTNNATTATTAATATTATNNITATTTTTAASATATTTVYNGTFLLETAHDELTSLKGPFLWFKALSKPVQCSSFHAFLAVYSQAGYLALSYRSTIGMVKSHKL